MRAVVANSAGCGLIGLMLAAVGADVIMTDRDPDVLAQLDLNVKENSNLKGQAVVRKLSWGDSYLETRGDVKEEFGQYDMVVGADIIYGESLNGPYKNLIHTLKSTVSSRMPRAGPSTARRRSRT